MKTVLLSVPYGMSARNFLRSDVYRLLKEHVRLHIVSPLANDEEFRQEFAGPLVEIGHVPYRWSLLRSLVTRLLFPLQAYWFTKKTQLTTLLYLKQLLKKIHPARYWLYVLLGETLGRLGFLRAWLERLYFHLMSHPPVEALFKTSKIDLVFLTHGYVHMEIEIAVQARKRKIPVINMVHSWDNLTSKSGLRQLTNLQVGSLFPVQLFDRILVWNDILKQELQDLYSVPEEKIFVTGVPQFDLYAHPEIFPTRNDYFTSIGADSSKKTIFFVATNPTFVHDQIFVLRGILEALRSGKLVQPCQLIVRTHPGSDMSNWPSLFKEPGVFFQHPSGSFTPKEIKDWDRKDDNALTLAKALYHCDILIHGASTTAIEAAVFNKPSISIGYDGDLAHIPIMPQYVRNTHYAKLIQTGGVRVAWNESQMIELINMYFQNPETDAEGRRLMVEQQCGRLDGKAGQRIAEYLLNQIN